MAQSSCNNASAVKQLSKAKEENNKGRRKMA
jgi:hypothetical protein